MKNVTRPFFNVNPCPHVGQYAHIVRTSDGGHAVMCDECHDAMMIGIKDFIRGNGEPQGQAISMAHGCSA